MKTTRQPDPAADRLATLAKRLKLAAPAGLEAAQKRRAEVRAKLREVEARHSTAVRADYQADQTRPSTETKALAAEAAALKVELRQATTDRDTAAAAFQARFHDDTAITVAGIQAEMHGALDLILAAVDLANQVRAFATENGVEPHRTVEAAPMIAELARRIRAQLRS